MPCSRSPLLVINATAMLGLWLLLGSAEVRAAEDVVFMASVDKTEVGLGEKIALIISVKAPGKVSQRNLKRPRTGTLKILSVRTEENVSFSFSGGNQSFSKIQKFVYILSPSKLGKTQIGAAKLKYKGKTYTTNPIDIEVVKARPRPKRRQPTRLSPFGSGSGLFPDDDWDSLLRRRDRLSRPAEIKESDIFVSVTATPDVVMQGQQVTATVRIYSRVGARIASIRWPKLDGFFSVDRDVSKVKTDQKYINGELYQYKVLDRKALFPLQPGEISLGPVEVEVEVSSSPFFPAQVRRLRTRPSKVKVMELPGENRPKSFQEANVGQYSLSANVDANEVSLNQPVTYTLRLRGTGNIQRVRPPELPQLPRFKTFDPTVDVQVSKRGREITGSKVFEYILVPLASGELTIPALEFSF
ncbi:MAG: protein BatD, partial [Deltaproteobacteria bacterium]|nr:protein BatD [Deltaproteobacteria bacterium]